MPKSATDYYHCEGANYNCAQSILKAFEKTFDISEAEIESYRKFGGGRADGNLCGALFSALALLKRHPKKKEKLKKEFERIVGASKCKEILAAKKTTCRDCVRVADMLLKEILKEI